MAIPTMLNSSGGILERARGSSSLPYLGEEATNTEGVSEKERRGRGAVCSHFPKQESSSCFLTDETQHHLGASSRAHRSYTHAPPLRKISHHHRPDHWVSPAGGLCLYKLEVDSCSNFDSFCKGVNTDSDLESSFIYAEGIKSWDSSYLTSTGDHDSCRVFPGVEGTASVKKECDSLHRDSDSFCCHCNGKKGFDPLRCSAEAVFGSDDSYDCVNLDSGDSVCIYTDSNEEGLGLSQFSVEAVLGSDYSYNSTNSDSPFHSINAVCDSDSTGVHTEWQWSFDSSSHSVTTGGASLRSRAEADWGSASSYSSTSSDLSGYSADNDSSESWCSVDRQSTPNLYESPAVTPCCDATGACRDSTCVTCYPGASERFCDSPATSHCRDGIESCYDSLAVTQDGDTDSHSSLGDETESLSHLLVHSKLPLSELRGTVTRTDRRHVAAFFREVMREAKSERKESAAANEGFLFHPQELLQAKNLEYREAQEYSLLSHIQNGSYGDVFSIRDKSTGFTCAAKKIPLCSFNWEEVGTWSALDSPHILQLFGAVREGPNIILFMDLKTGSVAQVLRQRGCLPEVLALYYHSQVLQALEHLQSRRVLHLDVKVDNVLLSEDGMQCFLCDFGLSEILDQSGCNTKTLRGNGLRGTETHMAPEVIRGDPRCFKADVWSSCCMLLHMLTGHQPWTRSYSHPLCLKIVNEPPPLWEIPPYCDPLTSEVIRAGLVKEPRQRASATQLLERALKALCAVGEVSGALRSAYQSVAVSTDVPEHQGRPPVVPDPITAATAPHSEDLSAPSIHWVSTWRERAEEEEEEEGGTVSEEAESDEWYEVGETEEGKKEEKKGWMERYWGEESEQGEATQSEEDRESPYETEERELRAGDRLRGCKNSEKDEKQGQDKTGSEEHRETSLEEDKRNDSEGERSDLEEEGVTWGRNDLEDKSDSEQERSEAEEEGSEAEEEGSDLESLRQQGSDWSEEEWEPFQRLQIVFAAKRQQSEDELPSSEEEERGQRQERGPAYISTDETYSPQPVTCRSGPELTDKDSDWSEDLSSGVFSSYNSQTDGQRFIVDWMASADQPPSCCFDGLGVDIWVEDITGHRLRIRERPHVTLGHVAMGISGQISMKAFSLATLDGKLVSPDMELVESGTWVQCVPAPDGSPVWDWRINNGKLEHQEFDRLSSDTCSTLAI